MKRVLKITGLSIAAAIGVVVAAGLWGLPQTLPPKPALTGTIERGTLEYGGRTRSWIAYVPAMPSSQPELVMVLHASMGTGQQVRETFGYDFDLLADHTGSIVVYPQGYEGHWNECKRRGSYAAKRENIDDVGFLHAVVDRMVKDHHADRTRVFVTGVSNGGSMTLRLAIETPDFARAYAAVVSSVPTPDNMAPTPSNKPVSMMLMNGTSDPMNPWGGGDVVLYGVWGNRGPVLSADASVSYFRKLAGLDGAAEVSVFPDRDSGDGSTVERFVWSAPGKHIVTLYAVRGGGHAAPSPAAFGRRLLGHINRDIHAANEIWDFFQSAGRSN